MKSTSVAAVLALRLLLVAADDVHLCAVDNPVSEARRSLIVYDHNVLRSRIAQAFSISPYGSQLPQASNIYRVAWNCELEHLAWSAVKSCSFQAVKHHLYAHNYDVIETNDIHEPDKLYTLAMEKWITSLKEANLTSDAIYFDGDEKLQPFANMIRSNTTEIGCSQARCGTWTATACFYNSPDIRMGEPIYIAGEGCRNNTDCTAHPNSTCDTSDSLCVVENVSEQLSTFTESHAIDTSTGTLPPSTSAASTTGQEPSTAATTTTASTMTPTECSACLPSTSTATVPTEGQANIPIVPKFVQYVLGENSLCPQNSGMTDGLRRGLLEIHNFRRSQLATGNVLRTKDHYMPEAANMVKLRYNCALEQYALVYASKCILKEQLQMQPRVQEEQLGGLSVIQIDSSEAADYAEAVQEAMRKWWKPIHRLPEELVFRNKHFAMKLNGFGQIAWAKNHEFGCGVVNCNGTYNVVCNYTPGGSRRREVFYLQGEPCTMCPAEMTCDRTMGLCELMNSNTGAISSFLMMTSLTLIKYLV